MNEITLSLLALALVFWWVGWNARETNKHEKNANQGRSEATVTQVASSIFTVIGGGEYGAAIALLLGYGLGGPAFLLGLAAAVLLFRLVAVRVWDAANSASRLPPLIDGYINYTTPDWLADQFGRPVATLGTVVTAIAFVSLLTLQFVLGGDLISGVTGWSYMWSASFMALVVAVYVTVGGFSALLHTDVWQGFIMWLSLIIVLVYVFLFQETPSSHVAGFESILSKTGEAFSHSFTDPTMLVMFLTTIVAAFSGPDIWQRVTMVANREDVAETLRFSAIAWVIFLIPMTLLAIDVVATNLPVSDDPLREYIKQKVAYGTENSWPRYIAATFACGLLAAFISTADTCAMLVTSTIQNEYRRWFPQRDRELSHTRTRVFVWIATIASLMFAVAEPNIATQFAGVISILSVMGVVVIASLFGRGNTWTSILGMGIGILLALAGTYSIPGLSFVYQLLESMGIPEGYGLFVPLVPPFICFFVNNK